MRKESLEFLKALLSTPSPTGAEAAGQKLWCEYARQFADEVHTDAYGNAVAVLNPAGSPKIMFDGHADEIALMINYISDEGFVYFQRVGGVDPAMIRGKRVNIHTAQGAIRGIIGAPAIHLRDRVAEPKAPKMHESFIDIGAKDGKAAKKRVAVGDIITFVDDFEIIHGDIAVARAFDNRAGTWVVIEALRLASAEKKLNCCLCACSSVQEEVGLMGAQMQVANVKPDAAVVVDVTHATDIPGVDPKQHGLVKLGDGPCVSIGRENHPVLVDRLMKVGKKKRIKLQTEAFGITGGTDALAIYTKNGGIPSVVASIPNRYMHTTVEMLNLKDLQHTADLLAAFAVDLKKNERFAVKI